MLVLFYCLNENIVNWFISSKIILQFKLGKKKGKLNYLLFLFENNAIKNKPVDITVSTKCKLFGFLRKINLINLKLIVTL